MKKIITILLLTISTTTFSQSYDLEMSLLQPMALDTVGDTVYFNVSIKNLGPSTIPFLEDVIFKVEGVPFGPSTTLGVKAIPTALAIGDSITASYGLYIVGLPPGQNDFCAEALRVGTPVTVNDPNTSNNQVCVTTYFTPGWTPNSGGGSGGGGGSVSIAEDFSFNGTIYNNSNNLFVSLNSDNSNNTVEIFNLSGQKILSDNVVGKSKTINIKSLTPGIYIVKIVNDSDVYTERFFKN